MSQSAAINLYLHQKQGVALNTEATEVLYGGAAGGGKSHLMRSASVIWCTEIPGLQVYLFRRIREDLVKNHMEGPKGYRQLLAPWVAAGFVEIVEDEIRFWNGSKIYLCHCKDDKDRFKYQGAEIHVLLMDELTHFTDVVYRFLRGRVRAVGLRVPPKYAGKFPRILCGSNPGNIGHHWVKEAFIDRVPPMTLRHMNDNEGGMVRQYIPAKLDDNPSMEQDDPNYRARLRGLGSPALVKAMEDGDWSVVAGAFFSEWATAKHVVEPFVIPPSWLRFGSLDWGSAKPFSMGWWAVSDGNLLPDGRQYPTGALIRYREWYGASAPDVGIKLTAEQLADGIKEREFRAGPDGKPVPERIDYRVADPACWKVDGGPSIAERMYNKGVLFRPADNQRLNGWDQVRARLLGADEPMLYVFSTCADFIRTVPALQHDPSRAEDVDSDSEDHCFAAGTLVETADGPMPIERLSSSGMVWSEGGLKRYCSARLTRRDAPVVRLIFDNGRQVVCTPDHRFKTQFGWVLARDLIDERRYVLMSDMGASSCASRLSQRPVKSFEASATTDAASTFSVKACASIVRFGKRIAAPFQMVGTSTIATRIARIIKLRILSACQSPNTSAIGMASCYDGAPYLTLNWHASPLLRGTAPLRGWRGINEIMSGVHAPDSMLKSENLAPTAARASLVQVAIALASAAMPARRHGVEQAELMTSGAHVPFAPPRSPAIDIVSSTPARLNAPQSLPPLSVAECLKIEDAGRADVYCLTVPDGAAFAIEGGLIVHNCGDETRYACMSRPWTRKPDVITPIRGTGEMTINEAWKLAGPKKIQNARI